MKKILLFTSMILTLSMGAVGYAQEPPARSPQPQHEQSTSAPATLKGCLTKGSQAKTYSLADEATGQMVTFAGSAKLDNYLNQTVELTGDMVERGGEKSFMPQTVKTVAASCKSGQN